MSIIQVDTLQKRDGSTFPLGKIGQVVQSIASSTVSLNTSGYVDTGLTASVTPSSSSSKILISVVQSIYMDGGDAGLTIRILRDSTTIFDQPIHYARFQTGTSNVRDWYPIQYLDSPSSTSSLTFKTQAREAYGTTEVQHNSIKSTITLMEVLAWVH